MSVYIYIYIYISTSQTQVSTSKERQALYGLKNDKNIVITGADKGSAVVVWDREDYIKEAEKQLGDSDVYEEVPDYPEPLISTIHRTIEKIMERGDLKKETTKYFEVKDPNLPGSVCCLNT